MNFPTKNLFCVLFCIASLTIGCKKPAPEQTGAPQASASSSITEKVYVVSATKAPLLTKPKKTNHADFFAYSGDVLTPKKKWPLVAWKGEIDGQQVERTEEMLEVARAPVDAMLFAFPSDLKPELTVASAKQVCSKMVEPSESAQCEANLRRILLPDGSSVGWTGCLVKACPVVRLGNNASEKITIDYLARLKLAQILGTPMLVATNDWTQSPDHTGSTAEYYALFPLRRVLSVVTTELDAHDPKIVRARSGQVEEKDGVLRFDGSLKDTDKNSARVMSEKAIQEIFRRGPDGVFIRDESTK